MEASPWKESSASQGKNYHLSFSLIIRTTSLLCFFLNAHRPGSLPEQLKVFWNQLLQAGCEGPTLISRADSWRNNTYLSSV
jgi:hypothetical protein